MISPHLIAEEVNTIKAALKTILFAFRFESVSTPRALLRKGSEPPLGHRGCRGEFGLRLAQ